MKNWKDIYKLPLIKDDVIDWVYDSNGNFVFQFQDGIKDETMDLIISVINGCKKLKMPSKFIHDNGLISIENGASIILIRGWGNLTGTGAHNLSAENASNIQDTFAEYIVRQLNLRD